MPEECTFTQITLKMDSYLMNLGSEIVLVLEVLLVIIECREMIDLKNGFFMDAKISKLII